MARKDLFAGLTFRDFNYSGQEFKLPILYIRQDVFGAVFTADYNALLGIMPSARLQPVKIWPGRGMVAINAFNYIETSIGPYGEFSVGVPCTIKHNNKTYLGVYVHRLPVTTEIARVAGVECWGYPKFICDMAFENTSLDHWVKLTLSGETIVEMRVRKTGLGLPLATDLPTITVNKGEIIFTKIHIQVTGRTDVQGLASLNLGSHEMGRELSRLGLSQRPILTADFVDARMVLPEGESLGPA